MNKEFTKQVKRAKKIINKMILKWQAGKHYENFGEKEYRKYREAINNNEKLSYAEKADLCGFLSTHLANINDNSKPIKI